MTPIALLDLASVAVFAASGALAASRQQLDVFGFLFIACLTSVGGGTLRDLMLGRDPVFWVSAPHILLLACTVAIVIFFTAHLLESRLKALTWLDACALPIAVSAGVGAAAQSGAGPVIVVTMGVVTGCFGGLMRDVVCNEVPLILKKSELYATATFAGALAGVIVLKLDLPLTTALVAAASVTFLLRAGSLLFGWSLPAYKARPPR